MFKPPLDPIEMAMLGFGFIAGLALVFQHLVALAV
jgi:hypothetical protein